MKTASSTSNTITSAQRKMIESFIDTYMKDHPDTDYSNVNSIASLRNSIAKTTKLSNVMLIHPVTEILSERLSSCAEPQHKSSDSEASFNDVAMEPPESYSHDDAIRRRCATYAACFGCTKLTGQDISYLIIATADDFQCPPSDVTQDIIRFADDYNREHADDVSDCSDNVAHSIISVDEHADTISDHEPPTVKADTKIPKPSVVVVGGNVEDTHRHHDIHHHDNGDVTDEYDNYDSDEEINLTSYRSKQRKTTNTCERICHSLAAVTFVGLTICIGYAIQYL